MMKITKPSFGEVLSTNYRQHPRYLGCIAHWLAIEGGGAGIYDLTHYGQAFLFDAYVWTIGKFGHAVQFGGTNAIMATSNGETRLPHSIVRSVSLWINRNDVSSGLRAIVLQRTNSTNHWQITIPSTADNTILMTINVSGTINTQRTTNQVVSTQNEYYHIVVNFDNTPTVHNIFVNGIDQSLTTGTDVTNAANGFFIGNSFARDRPFPGIIDDVRIYNRFLTAQEVSSLYQDPFLEFKVTDSDLSRLTLDLIGQRKRASGARILQPYNLCEPFPDIDG